MPGAALWTSAFLLAPMQSMFPRDSSSGAHEHSLPYPHHPLVPHPRPSAANHASRAMKNDQRASVGYSVGQHLLRQTKAAANMPLLESATHCLRSAGKMLPLSHPERSACYRHLATALLTRFSFWEWSDEVIVGWLYFCAADMKMRVCDLRADEIQNADPLHTLKRGRDLLDEFNQTLDLLSINKAIRYHREALSLRTEAHPERPKSIHQLSAALLLRSNATGCLSDSLEAVWLLRRLPISDGRRLFSLLAALISAALNGQRSFSAEEEMWRLWVLALDSMAKVESKVNRGYISIAEYDTSNDPKHLDAAIAELSELDPDSGSSFHWEWRARRLIPLGEMYLVRFECRGDHDDLDQAVQVLREAIDSAAETSPERSTAQVNLPCALHVRFKSRGNPADLDEAIQVAYEARSLPEAPFDDQLEGLNKLGRAEYRSAFLNTLGGLLVTRFIERGDPADIEKSVEIYREALELRPPPTPFRDISLNNLGLAHYLQFLALKDYRDLEASIVWYRMALKLEPSPHAERYRSLNNLGRALQVRFYYSHIDLGEIFKTVWRLETVEEALIELRKELEIRSNYLGNDGRKDAGEAVKCHEEALALTETRHIDRSQLLLNLARCLLSILRTSCGKDSLDRMMSVLREGTEYEYSPVDTRLSCALQWAETASTYNHPSSMDAHRIAILELLPQFAPLNLHITERLRMLQTVAEKTRGISSSAVSCAVKLQRYDTAVELLEASRSLFWREATKARGSLENLSVARPDLATKLSKLSRELERGTFDGLQNPPNVKAVEAEATHRRRMKRERDETVKRVRQLPGFEDFLRNKDAATLRRAAARGPVVMLTASESSGVALILTSNQEVQHLNLPAASLAGVRFYANLFRGLLRYDGSPFDFSQFQTDPEFVRLAEAMRLLGVQELPLPKGAPKLTPEKKDALFAFWLGVLWTAIVNPVIDALQLKKTNDPPRVWWCPTGLFTFLPLHAAGVYTPGHQDRVFDYVISSYTPTLDVLLGNSTPYSAQFRMTSIIEPRTLPHATAELKEIRKLVPPDRLSISLDSTSETALRHLHQSSIVHFACHGIQDLKNPLNSALLLTGGQLKVSEIMQPAGDSGAGGAPGQMSLAFLAACQTAKGDKELPDEAFHLVASLLFAGFRGVVGTMWNMDDRDGPKLAREFYGHLFANCDWTADPPVLPDLSKAAEALQIAVAKLREDPEVPSMRWASFVHYGF